MPWELKLPRFGLGMRVRTTKDAGHRWPPHGPGGARVDVVWGKTGTITNLLNNKPLFSVDHDPSPWRADEAIVHLGKAWYDEAELELEVGGQDPHAGLIVDLVLGWDSSKAKVLADVCEERGMFGAAVLLRGRTCYDLRFMIEMLAQVAGIKKSEHPTTHWKGEWELGWLPGYVDPRGPEVSGPGVGATGSAGPSGFVGPIGSTDPVGGQGQGLPGLPGSVAPGTAMARNNLLLDIIQPQAAAVSDQKGQAVAPYSGSLVGIRSLEMQAADCQHLYGARFVELYSRPCVMVNGLDRDIEWPNMLIAQGDVIAVRRASTMRGFPCVLYIQTGPKR